MRQLMVRALCAVGACALSLLVACGGGGDAEVTAQAATSVTAAPAEAAPLTRSQSRAQALGSGWEASATPTNPSSGDTNAVNLGVKFRTSVAGSVTGVRFYKGVNNTGTHVGSLWSSSGQLLASATFSGESATGWQQVNFSTPVSIAANTVYVVSYHAPNGGYAFDSQYFLNSGVVNGPVELLQNGVSGGNGVYQYAATSAFPSQSFDATNYWVDVVFDTAPVGPDTTPPTISSRTPAPEATGIAPTASVTVTFSEAIDASSVNGSIELRNATVLVDTAVAYDSASRTVTLTPTAPLATSTTYTVTVRGGSTDPRIKDVVGNALASTATWSFTTSSQSGGCPCSGWPAQTAPTNPSSSETNAVNLGVKFRTSVAGSVTGVRFYKGVNNTGTHVGSLWSSSGQLLASATFSGESATGWQQVNFSTPVSIAANTVYVVSYHAPNGGYAFDSQYFLNSGVVNGPVELLQNGVSGGNGVYQYAATSAFPSQSFSATNYWVDVVFTTSMAPDTTPPTPSTFTPAAGATGVAVGSTVRATFNEAIDPSTLSASTFELRDAANALVAATLSYDAGSMTATLTPSSPLAVSSTYTATLRGGATDPRIKDTAGNALAASTSWSFTTASAAPPSGCPCSGWPSTTVPGTASVNDSNAIELGVKFRATTSGFITGVRFYKGATNTGTHIGNLWTSGGQLLATATFSGETATGWQQVNFASPVAITANTIYVASYFAPNGNYAADGGYFANSGVTSGPVQLLQSGGASGGNGVYQYSSTSSFPSLTFNNTNYWVDVVFTAATGPDTTPPTLNASMPAAGATGVGVGSTVRATFNEAIDPSTLSASTFELRDAANALVAATLSYDAGSMTATLTPSSPLAVSSTYTATLRGGATDPRIKDTAGNALAASTSWSFTTATQSGGCPCSAWPPTAVPTNPSSSETTAIELGVKFRATQDGYITGIRFYKGVGNTGTHLGSLWTLGGQRLAVASFVGETATGWQQVDFGAPVAITANTVYVASYFAPNGRYAGDNSYFVASGVTNGPVELLRDGVSGGNGVFLYGESGGFPTLSFQGSNYWVDVVFTPTPPADVTPPSVAIRTPAPGAAGVGITSAVRVVFDEALDPSSLTGTTFELRNPANALVAASVAYDAPTRTATLQPSSALAVATTYTVTLRGGSTDPRVKDLSGNALAANISWSFTTETTSACTAPANAMVAENCQPGNAASEWDIIGAGDTTIQGYATQISVNRGSTVNFKVATNASAYRFDIYRIGYYGGAGARKVATVLPSATLPQTQPSCLNDPATGLIDCGNWAVSGSWAIPSTATSGVYIARLVRTDTGGASHIFFIVRNDAGTSDLLYKTSDTTWQAYNDYGGNSLYVGSPAGRAYKVSYNRPFVTRGSLQGYGRAFFFGAEYPMVRWLESNGYDVSYVAGADVERNPALIQNHRVLLSVGHDEYWSAGQRAAVEGARDAGVNLAFFSGNEMFWKTRWENSIDGSATAYRTLVTYKETHAAAKIDPTAAWTGTWRDPRFSPPADGGRPENAVTGTIFTVNCCSGVGIQVPAEYGNLRFWRNTSVATLPPGQVAMLPQGTLGYEWDEDLDNGFRPPGLFQMSSTPVAGVSYLQDYGSTYASGNATHALTMHKRANGARVFGAGTVRWSWGLDGTHDADFATSGASTVPDVRMQQATVNLLADMNSQPGSLRPGLVAATASTDVSAPSSTISSPASGATLPVSVPVTISGTASDAGGVVGGVEVSIDGGTTWRRANGRTAWTYTWTPTSQGAVTLRSRSTDDSGNIQTSPASVSVTVGTGGGGDTTAPTISNRSPASGATGVATGSDVTVTFSEAMDASTISASTIELRDASNALVAGAVTYNAATLTATFNPTPTLANGSTYTVRVLGGATDPRVKDVAGNALAGTASWTFTTAAAVDTTPPTIAGRSPASGATGVSRTANITVTFSEPMNASTISASTIELRDAASNLVSGVVSYNGTTRVATLNPTPTLAASSVHTVRVVGGAAGVKDVAGNALAADVTWSYTTVADTTAPTVSSVTPASAATNVSRSTTVRATFSEDMDATTINTTTFVLVRNSTGATVAATVVYDAALRRATLTPSSTLASQAGYTATVRGGSTDPRVKDAAGNALAANRVWSFTTRP